jgi:hypothetical protein
MRVLGAEKRGLPVRRGTIVAPLSIICLSSFWITEPINHLMEMVLEAPDRVCRQISSPHGVEVRFQRPRELLRTARRQSTVKDECACEPLIERKLANNEKQFFYVILKKDGWFTGLMISVQLVFEPKIEGRIETRMILVLKQPSAGSMTLSPSCI